MTSLSWTMGSSYISKAIDYTAIGYGLDKVATVLSWPSSVLVGKAHHKPLWTTKYILAMNYQKQTQSSARCYKEITDARWAYGYSLATRVLWAVSVVLPVLDVLAWIVRQVAKIDSTIASKYDVQKKNSEVLNKEREFSALADSVREFAGFLLIIGCKKELDENLPHDELLRMRRDEFRNFCSHFAKNQPRDAILESIKGTLEILQKRFYSTNIQDNDLSTAIKNAFLAINAYLQQDKSGESCSFMMGEKENPLYPAWECLTANYERFYQLCKMS